MVDLRLVKPEHLWYVVGLITTDGYLSIDRRHIIITSKDEEILVKVKNSLFLDNKIGRKSRGYELEKKYFVLQIGDVKFYKFLLNVGLHNNKSLTMEKLSVPSKYFIDFLRGVIDGDGSIERWIHRSNGYEQWSLRVISGAPIFLQWLKEEIEKNFSVRGKLYGYLNKGKKNKIYSIKFGKLSAKVILKGCYYKNCLSLERKLVKANECLKTINGLSKYGNVITT